MTVLVLKEIRGLCGRVDDLIYPWYLLRRSLGRELLGIESIVR